MAEPYASARLRAGFPDPRAAAERAAQAARAHGSEVQLVRPEAVAGPRHLASAAEHALRSAARGKARAQSLAMEFLCYLAGDRQIARALARAGLPPGAADAVAVALGGDPRRALGAVAAALGAELAWDAVPARAGDPDGAERGALERVALVDIER